MNDTLEMPAPMPAPAAKSKTAKTAKHRILLVDDDPAIRQILLRLLAEEGYLVLTAGNGVEALELANEIKFDLVLLDLNMPVKDGWETFGQMSKKKLSAAADHPDHRAPQSVFSRPGLGRRSVAGKAIGLCKTFFSRSKTFWKSRKKCGAHA